MFELFKTQILEGRIESIFSLSANLLIKNPDLPRDYQDILKTINNGQIQIAIEQLNQLSVKYANDQSLFFVKEYFEKNMQLLENIYAFMKKFDSKKPKISIFIDGYFLIGKETTEMNTKIQSIEDLKKIASNMNPNSVYHNGKLYDLVATSTPQKFLRNILSEDLKAFLQNVDYYEALYYLFEKIDEKVQRVFSENRIGIYIHNKEIYLIKFVPMPQFDEVSNQSKVIILDLKNSGKIIGVKLEGYNKLSDVVQFEFQDDESRFVPKFYLDVSIFFSNKKGSIDFKTENGLQDFCYDLNERINSAIEILNGKKQFSLDKTDDIKMYTEFEIQKVQKLDNLSARVSKLSALIKLKQAPDMYLKIKEKLEENFILYIDFLMNKGKINDINNALESIEKIKIFDTAEGRIKLLRILSLDIKNLKIEPKEIINLIKKLEAKYSFKNEDFRIFSDGYLMAVAKLAPNMILTRRFDDLKALIDIRYLNNNSEIISIFVSVLINISYDPTDLTFPIEKFIKLIEIVFDFINKFNPDKTFETHLNNLQAYFKNLITRSPFVSGLLIQNLNFLETMVSIKQYVFKDPENDFKEFLNLFDEALIRNQIENNSIEFDTTKNLHKIVLSFYKKNYPEQYLDYILKLISEFNRRKPNEIHTNQLLYFNATSAEIFKQWSKELTKSNNVLNSLITSFLENWYLESNPNSLFDIHYNIIETLGQKYQDISRLQRMKRNLKLNETLSVINNYQDHKEIERNLEAYLINHVQKSVLFEQEYFEYLQGLIKRDFAVFFDFSCIIFHLNAIQRVYKGQNNAKVNHTFNLFEEQLSRFFQVEIRNSFLKTVREYLERIEKTIPSILKNAAIYTSCIEILKETLQIGSNLSEGCLLYLDLFQKMEKFSNLANAKASFISLGFEILHLIIESLNLDLIAKQEFSTDTLKSFFRILIENVDEQNKSNYSMIDSINHDLENIFKFPISSPSVLILVGSLKDSIVNLSSKKKKALFEKTSEILNSIESEIKQREIFIKTLEESADISKLTIIKKTLETKIAEIKANRFDFHILVLVCKGLKAIDLARNYAIQGMNIEGVDSILEKIMRNFIKITKKAEFKKCEHLIRADLVPYIRPALS